MGDTMRIASNDFLSFCQSLEGQPIPSRAGRTRFLVRLADNGLVFILPSGASRLESLRKVDAVLDRFDQTESFTTRAVDCDLRLCRIARQTL